MFTPPPPVSELLAQVLTLPPSKFADVILEQKVRYLMTFMTHFELLTFGPTPLRQHCQRKP